MTPNNVRKVVIVGGGLAGWLTAAALARSFGEQLKITVLEREVDSCDALLVASRPDIAALHAQLGIEEAKLVPATGATFNVGMEMSGWGTHTRSYFLPFGEVGTRLANLAFHQHVRRLTSQGHAFDLRDFSVAGQASRAARFAHPSADARSVTSTFAYGLNLDPTLYSKVLRAFALQAGAVAHAALLQTAKLREDGFIESLTLSDGATLAGDLFIDCSGRRARLMGEVLGVGYQSWATWLPNNRAVLTTAPADAAAMPAARAEARPEGWLWSVPLQQRVDRAFLFSADSCTEHRALQQLGHPATHSALAFESGRREKLWVHNCIAIGGSGYFLEPLASPGLHLLQASVLRLLMLFPHDLSAPNRAQQVLADEYDRVVGGELERSRDMLALHFHAAGKANSLPELLAYKLKLFGGRGRLALYDEEVFSESEWVSALIGLGFEPARYDVLADQMDASQTVAMLERIQNLIADAVRAMPPHLGYAQRFGRPT